MKTMVDETPCRDLRKCLLSAVEVVEFIFDKYQILDYDLAWRGEKMPVWK